MVARLVRDQKVVGSSPVASTKITRFRAKNAQKRVLFTKNKVTDRAVKTARSVLFLSNSIYPVIIRRFGSICRFGGFGRFKLFNNRAARKSDDVADRH